eukprot:TRINITY_DN5087_c0_g1_i1.p1 TRINITY_DN5087_c0_g1~~TRINITY_DN5087_c0_g1_i1.p1  ORF type:complete len:301 (-),score=75.24 TRINITY_DN5087_c0_g1_i1:88-990(-)
MPRFPPAGAGVLLHRWLCGQSTASEEVSSTVVAPRYLALIALPCVQAMISYHPMHPINAKGWQLLSAVTRGVPRASLSGNAVSDFVILCSQAMIASMTQCEDNNARSGMYRVFGHTLTLLFPATRFDVIKALIKNCPYHFFTGLLVHQLKEEIDHAWPNVCDNTEETVNFASRKILELLPLFMSSLNFTERSDIIIEGINLYRYLLIKDKGTNYTGAWTSGQMLEVEQHFLRPLEDDLQRMRQSFTLPATEADVRAKLAELRKNGLPDMSNEEFKATNARVVTNIVLVLDLIARVRELAM